MIVWVGGCGDRLDGLPGVEHVGGGPGPVRAQVQPLFAMPAGEPGGELPEPAAQQFQGGVAQLVCGEGELAEAGQQVRGQRDDLGPGEVDRPEPGGPVVQAEVLGLFDVVLHVHVGAVAAAEPGDLPDPGVGVG